jgi:hypothetical protein
MRTHAVGHRAGTLSGSEHSETNKKGAQSKKEGVFDCNTPVSVISSYVSKRYAKALRHLAKK